MSVKESLLIGCTMALTIFMSCINSEASGAKAIDEQALMVGAYGLSRGRGVPQKVVEALKEISELAVRWKKQGLLESWQQKRLGLEGEKVICMQFYRAEDAVRIHDLLRSKFSEYELMNIEIATC